MNECIMDDCDEERLDDSSYCEHHWFEHFETQRDWWADHQMDLAAEARLFGETE